MIEVDYFVIGVGIVGVFIGYWLLVYGWVVVLECEVQFGYYFIGCFVVYYMVVYGIFQVCVFIVVSWVFFDNLLVGFCEYLLFSLCLEMVVDFSDDLEEFCC